MDRKLSEEILDQKSYHSRNAMIDKKTLYKWKDISDNKGELIWIDKKDLTIDHNSEGGYQRVKIKWSRVNKIASEWCWMSCGVLCVAERSGTWFVFDGQHRLLAAKKRSDIDKLPCIVFQTEDRQSEAGAFDEINNSKSAVTGIDRFMARIVAGDEGAVELQKLLHATGLKITDTDGAGTARCVITLWKLHERDPQMFRDIWPLIVDIHLGASINNRVVKALWIIEIMVRRKGMSLTENPYRGTLLQLGAEALNAEIGRETVITGKGGEKVFADAVIKILNKQIRSRKHKILL